MVSPFLGKTASETLVSLEHPWFQLNPFYVADRTWFIVIGAGFP
jgi:hypothetical protein